MVYSKFNIVAYILFVSRNYKFEAAWIVFNKFSTLAGTFKLSWGIRVII
jgi:hypothetical protein